MKDKILVIDDEDIIRKRLKKLISLDGYEVFTTESGQKGLDTFQEVKDEKQDPIKVVIVDIKMPGMDGNEVLREIKKSTPQTEVIMITGHGAIESAIKALRRGAFDYITKPIEYDELALAISRALEKQKLISAHRKVQEELETSQASFRNIVEKSADGIIIVDKDGIVRFINLTAEHIFGRKAEEFFGELFGFPVITGESIEVDIIRPNTKPGTGEMRVVETEWENEFACLISIRDITERKWMEDKLRKNEERAKAHYKNIPIPTYTWRKVDDNFILIDYNRIAEKISRGKITSFLGRKAEELYPNSPETLEDMTRCFTEKTVIKREIQPQDGLTNKGKYFDFTYAFVPPDNVMLHTEDITEEKEIDKMKTEFVSVVGHELRTPLTSMKNAVDIVLSETAGAINKNQRKFLFMADRNIDRLSGIINELLDISKIESGSIKIELKSLDLGAPLDMAIASLESKAGKKSISLHKEMPSDLPQIYGDSNKLEQIFINLLSNAIKFTPKGDHVSVSAKDYEYNRDFIEVCVADTGIGISPDELEKIFDRFYQVEKSLTRETEGTGLGLSIVKGLVEAHGGEIWVESEEGKKGSKFTFTLPKYSPERVLKEYLDREIAGAGEKGAPLSLMMLKIEEFEYLSETYGEAETLKLLDDVKGIIQDTARRTTDMIKTQTPDRILVILPDTPKEGAVALGNRIKEVFSKQTFTLSKDSMKINLVSGLATYPEDGVTADELIKKVQSQFKIKEAVSTVEKVVGR